MILTKKDNFLQVKGYIYRILTVVRVRDTYSIKNNFKDTDDIITLRSRDFHEENEVSPDQLEDY